MIASKLGQLHYLCFSVALHTPAMATDVTKLVEGLPSRVLFFGVTFEMFILILQGSALLIVATLWLRDLRRRRFSNEIPAGCVRLGLTGASHCADEFEKKYKQGTSDTSKWRVKALYIHPIKSCAGVEVDVADVEAQGMTWDRRFAFAEWRQATKADADGNKPYGWRFRTLRDRSYERLALVKPEVWIPKSSMGQLDSLRVEQEGCLIVRYPNVPTGFLAPFDRWMMNRGLVPKQSSFKLPLIPRQNHRYPMEDVTVWRDEPKWINMGEHLPKDFVQWLGAGNKVTIFRADPENYRKVFRNAPKAEELGWQPEVAFSDSYPLHMMNIASVHDVSEKVGDAIPDLSFRRFRPNILIEGPPAYDEDDWKLCRIGKNEVYCSCRTTRCLLPNVDPDTAVRHGSEPNKALKSFRCVDPGDTKNAVLGMQCVPATNEPFQIRVGDSIEVLKRGHHHHLKE